LDRKVRRTLSNSTWFLLTDLRPPCYQPRTGRQCHPTLCYGSTLSILRYQSSAAYDRQLARRTGRRLGCRVVVHSAGQTRLTDGKHLLLSALRPGLGFNIARDLVSAEAFMLRARLSIFPRVPRSLGSTEVGEIERAIRQPGFASRSHPSHVALGHLPLNQVLKVCSREKDPWHNLQHSLHARGSGAGGEIISFGIQSDVRICVALCSSSPCKPSTFFPK